MKYLYVSILAVFVALSAFAFGTNYSTYDLGYNHGYSNGYEIAYEIAMANYPVYPKMTLEGWEYNSGNSTVIISGVTFEGEQSVLDAIAEMPEILKVKQDENTFSIQSLPSGEATMIFSHTDNSAVINWYETGD
ncbi:MAG: hypothetical protein PHQ86_06475 [Dehalococcoidales bacterium]|nr:hypothetical protein [Dehalococcoidales bacterium]